MVEHCSDSRMQKGRNLDGDSSVYYDPRRIAIVAPGRYPGSRNRRGCTEERDIMVRLVGSSLLQVAFASLQICCHCRLKDSTSYGRTH